MGWELGDEKIDAVAFQKRKAIRKGNNYQSKNSEMEILDEGALDKVLTVSGNTLEGKPLRKKIYEVIDNEWFKPTDDELPK